MTPLEAL
jgi:hypothetical protein